jgi:hypothetical protein
MMPIPAIPAENWRIRMNDSDLNQESLPEEVVINRSTVSRCDAHSCSIKSSSARGSIGLVMWALKPALVERSLSSNIE